MIGPSQHFAAFAARQLFYAADYGLGSHKLKLGDFFRNCKTAPIGRGMTSINIPPTLEGLHVLAAQLKPLVTIGRFVLKPPMPVAFHAGWVVGFDLVDSLHFVRSLCAKFTFSSFKVKGFAYLIAFVGFPEIYVSGLFITLLLLFLLSIFSVGSAEHIVTTSSYPGRVWQKESSCETILGFLPNCL